MPDAWRSRVLLPQARSAILVASGGRSLWDAFVRAPEFGASADPLDAYTRRVTETAAAALDPAGDALALFAFEQRGGAFADFVELGRLAGLGAASRLGLLLHPLYGPWLSLRAIVLTRVSRETGATLAFDPCRDCPAPCESAGPDFTARRRACVVGPEHVYGAAALAHHAHHADLLQLTLPGLRAR